MALAVGLPMSGLPFVGSAYGCPPPPGKGHLLTVGTLPRCFEGDLGDSATILGRERGVALAPGTCLQFFFWRELKVHGLKPRRKGLACGHPSA